MKFSKRRKISHNSLLMKLSYFSFSLIALILNSCSPKVYQPFKAQYSYTFGTSSELAGELAGNFHYTVLSNNTFTFLNASVTEIPYESNVNYIFNGPESLVMNSNGVIFSKQEDISYKYLPVEVTNTGFHYKINGYNTILFITKNNDSLYLSKKLDSHINPFLLGKESLYYGLVKARMRDGGVFLLNSAINIQDLNIPEPEASKFLNFTTTKNPFFE